MIAFVLLVGCGVLALAGMCAMTLVR